MTPQQQSFWGMDEDGFIANSGERIVYFFDDDPYIKVGFTAGGIHGVKQRATAFACGNPRDIKLLGMIVVKSEIDDRDLHRRLAPFHYKREWFHKTPELLAVISDLLHPPDVIRTIDVTTGGPGLYWLDVDCLTCGHPLDTCLKVVDVPTKPPQNVRATVTGRSCGHSFRLKCVLL